MGAWVKTELILSRVCASIIAICGVVCTIFIQRTTSQCLKVFQKVSFYQQFCKNVGNAALLGLF